MAATALETLRAMRACDTAITWAESHGGDLDALWRDCPRGDWLLWYAAKAGARQEDLVRAAAGCAELALPYAGGAREVCEAAIAAARAWADAPGPETRAAARSAVYAAARSAAYAADAAGAAAYAAADAAAYAAAEEDAAEDAAEDASNAAVNAAAADAAAEGEMRRRCADVVRACVPFVEVVR